jgi:hypothetical protein
MSGNRKMLRDRVRRHLKKAKKSVPAEHRNNITFSSVFNILKSVEAPPHLKGSTREVGIYDDVQDFPTASAEPQVNENEDSDPKSTTDI